MIQLELKDWQGEVETLGEWQSQLDGAENMGEQGQNYNLKLLQLKFHPGGAAVLPTTAKEELTLVDLTHCDNKMVTKVMIRTLNCCHCINNNKMKCCFLALIISWLFHEKRGKRLVV